MNARQFFPLLASLLVGQALWLAPPCRAAEGEFLEEYPNLEKFLFAERKSNLYFGFGLSPMTIQNSRIGFSANLLQVHYIRNAWDLELFSASFGITLAQQDYAQTRFYVLRTNPKYRIFRSVSIGPVGGIEFVTFPNLNSQLLHNGYVTLQENYSSYGFIYGAMLAQTFNIGQNHLLKINELFYFQNYPYKQSPQGWDYVFQTKDGQEPDVNLIKTSSVFALEISFLL
jgi:hypothetical protein